MASLKKLSRRGASVYRISYRVENQTKRKMYPNFEDACHALWMFEIESFTYLTQDEIARRKAPTLAKILCFYIGGLVHKYENNQLSHETVKRYITCLNGLSDELLSTRLDRLTQRLFYDSVPASSQPYVMAAIRHHNLTFGTDFYDVYPPKSSRKPAITIPNRSDVNALIELCRTAREKVFFYLAAVCGLRVSEIMALTWDKLTDTGFVVDQHISNGAVVDGHKSGRVRMIECDQVFFDLVSELNRNAKFLIENKYHPEKFLSWSAFWKRFIGPIFAATGATFTPHCLRHYAISQCIANKWDILKVQNFAGHSNVRTTLEIYGHLINKAPAVVNTFKFGGMA